MQKISPYKRFLSYFYPVRIHTASGSNNPVLELYLYRGRWQLATIDALYSDGNKYTPLVRAFKEVKTKLQGVKKILVLGTGLGSAVQIFHSMGYKAQFTLVDNDAVILKWAMELMNEQLLSDITPVCADAKTFITDNKETCDMLIVDIFQGRVVPGFVTGNNFLQECRRHINTGGIFIMNYIAIREAEWANVKRSIDQVFPTVKVLNKGLNRIIIATV
ncbi:MAG: class I SAM-dependent methyltransferase [Bacteroidetes bacterium]|nr:class I SAM-dependent methyltransferase [Bacteroidota bacterium]